MTRHIFFDDQGRVVQTTSGGHPETVAMSTGLSYIESDEPVTGESWVDGGVLHNAPARPSPRHQWDWQSKSWVQNLSAARASKIQAIEASHAAAAVAPIQHQGARLDADVVAQYNISAKLQEIEQRRVLGVPMPAELLVWRDTDNALHVFATPDDLASWLGHLAIAIAERGTRLYLWSWGQKALALAAQDTTALEAVSEVSPD
jgi:hypothetical protein